jgi:hypothetical protein
MKRINFWRLGAASLALASVAATAAGTGHQWGDYRWTASNTPVTLTLSYKFAQGTTDWVDYSTKAIAKWEAGSSTYGDPLTLGSLSQASTTKALDANGNFTTTTVTITPQDCQPIQAQVLVCAANYGGSEGWVGIAEIDLIPGTNRFAWATAKFNDYYFNAGQPNYNVYGNDGQRQFVTCHEIGHTFGLGHLDTGFYNKNKGSCMDYTADPDGPPDNRNPGVVDWQVLNSTTMYGTYTPTKGGKPGGGGGGRPLEPVGNADPFQFREVGALPSEPQGNAYGRFGKIVEYDDDGRPTAFVRNMPNGHARVTYVTWAKGHRPAGSR